MTDFAIEQARRLRQEGSDNSAIRKYLVNTGLNDDEASEIIQYIEDEEIYNLLHRQRIGKARTEFIVSILAFVAASTYDIYEYVTEQSVSLAVLVFAMAFLIYTYSRFNKVRQESFSTSQLLRKSRKESYFKRKKN